MYPINPQNKLISVNKALRQVDLSQFFRLPLSEEAFSQLQSIIQTLNGLILTEEDDVWRHAVSLSKAYKILIGHTVIEPAYKWLRECSCQPKHKFFFWLLIKNRLSTRNILRRKIWSWIPTIMFYATRQVRKLLPTYSFNAFPQYNAR